MHNELLFQAFVYLVAAVLSCRQTTRTQCWAIWLQGGHWSVCVRLCRTRGDDVMHFAEFGVVMMLFLVGLELQPSLLWRLRVPILGLGGCRWLTGRRHHQFHLGTLLANGSGGWHVSSCLQRRSCSNLNEKGLIKTKADSRLSQCCCFRTLPSSRC